MKIDHFKTPSDGALPVWHLKNGKQFTPPEFYLTGTCEQIVRDKMEDTLASLRARGDGELYVTARSKSIDAIRSVDGFYFLIVSAMLVIGDAVFTATGDKILTNENQVFLPKNRNAEILNEWMRRYTQEPDKFEREFVTVGEFLKDESAGLEPSYGAVCAAYMEKINSELPQWKA